MRMYIVKQSQYKPLEGKEIGLEAVGGKITLADIMNEIKKINKRLDKHDEMFIKFDQILTKHDEIFAKYDKVFVKYDKIFVRNNLK